MEAACDESGSDGENLTGGNTDVFAHASVVLPQESAAGYIREIRRRIRSPAEEYKANHLLREKHRAVLEWLLAPSGPLYGHAHVHLVEKAFFLLDRTADLLLADPGAAAPLYTEGRATFSPGEWREFLTAANRMLWVRSGASPGEPAEPVEAFFGTVAALRRAYPGTAAADVLERFGEGRSRAHDRRTAILAGRPPVVPALNPLPSSILRTAAHWSRGGRPVRLAHDRQNMLTPERIAWIEEAARREGIGLTGLRLVVAGADARVQLADFLAGIARRFASDELNGTGDPELTALLRPYTGETAVWGDAGSGARLGTAPVSAKEGRGGGEVTGPAARTGSAL